MLLRLMLPVLMLPVVVVVMVVVVAAGEKVQLMPVLRDAREAELRNLHL